MAAKIPKNVRFRPDQISALERLQSSETDFSALVRTAVDRYLESGASVRERPAVYGTSQTIRKLGTAAAKFNKTKKQQAAPKKSGAA